MKITKQQLKKLIEQELKEIEFGLDGMPNLDEPREPKERDPGEDIAAADTVEAEPISRERTGSLRNMSEEDRQLYFAAQGQGDYGPSPEVMRKAVIALLRDKYNL
jgi:hypothetical protein